MLIIYESTAYRRTLYDAGICMSVRVRQDRGLQNQQKSFCKLSLLVSLCTYRIIICSPPTRNRKIKKSELCLRTKWWGFRFALRCCDFPAFWVACRNSVVHFAGFKFLSRFIHIANSKCFVDPSVFHEYKCFHLTPRWDYFIT